MRQPALPPTAVIAVAGLTVVGCSYDPFDTSGMSGEQSQNAPGQAPPVFGDIREELFDTMLAAESVSISGEVEASDADLDDLFDGIEEDTAGQLQISGAIEGTESEMSFSAGGSSFTQRAIEGEEYFRGEDFAALLVSELDDEVAEVVDEEFIAETVADQWVQFDDAEDPSVFSAEEFITTWREELNTEGASQMQAEADQREGQQVWVYTADAGESEFVVAAEGQPYLLSIRDGDSYYQFSEWNQSPAPEAPEEVITLDELFEAIAQEQGWPAEDEIGLDQGADAEG